MCGPFASALGVVHLSDVAHGARPLELEVDLLRLEARARHLQELPRAGLAAPVGGFGVLVKVVSDGEQILGVRGGVREPVLRVRGRVVHLLLARFSRLPVVRLDHVVDVDVLVVRRGATPGSSRCTLAGLQSGEANGHVRGPALGEHPAHALALGEVDRLAGGHLDGGTVGVLDVHLTLLHQHPLVELGRLPGLRPAPAPQPWRSRSRAGRSSRCRRTR